MAEPSIFVRLPDGRLVVLSPPDYAFPGLLSGPGNTGEDRGKTPTANAGATSVFPGGDTPLKGGISPRSAETGEEPPRAPRSLSLELPDRGSPSLAELLAGVQAAIRELGERIDGIDRRLKEPNARQTQIEDSIRRSHDGYVNRSPARIAARKPLYAQLTELAIRYGPLRQERRECAVQAKGLERQAEMIGKEIRNNATRKAKRK